LLRIASDMILICNESLEICHHNRAFLKGIGHNEGTFIGQNLLAFIEESERDGVIEAFSDWRKGHAAGMRFLATLLTTRGGRSLEVRAVRSRDRDGSFLYYLIARDASETRRSGRHASMEVEPEPFLRGLPIAAWRTDGNLRITQAYGALWPELGLAVEDLIGESLHPASGGGFCSLFPEIDCGDVLAGLALDTSMTRNGDELNVGVQPIHDASGRLIATIGLIRRMKVGGLSVPLDITQESRHHAVPAPGGESVAMESWSPEPLVRRSSKREADLPAMREMGESLRR